VGVTSLAAVVSVVALVVDIGSPHSASVGDLSPDNASLAPSEASVDESAAAFEPPQSLRLDRNPAVPERVVDVDNIPPVECDDEETISKRLRERGIREVTKVYSLLFDSLDLAQNERNALVSLLVDLRVAGTHTDCKRGRKIDPQVRSDQVAAIIGDTKLEQFLSLEQHLGSYAEVAFVNCVLEKHDRPMTDAERNEVLQILIDIRERELALPGADAARGSVESLEYRLAEIDERERLFFEQVASQLSAEQVGYLFEQYQRDSYFRADALERQRRARADENAEVLPLHYPARSCSYAPQ
jgi:hypothetical protein